MELLVNDCSLHGQFHTVSAFREALGVMMAMRTVAKRLGWPVRCHRSFLSARLGPEQSLQQAVGALPRELKMALLAWVTREGPFWDEVREHQRDDWLEWRGDIVTDTALGEAAFATLQGRSSQLLSFSPSACTESPLAVDWVREDGRRPALVPNHWTQQSLEQALESQPKPLGSWADLESLARARYTELTITPEAFSPLRGCPFSASAAKRIDALLGTLHRLRQCFDEHGMRTPEGHEIYRDFFTGERARFTDSSDTEKHKFADSLTFKCPGQGNEFCPWHGKVQTPQLRVHFSYPIDRDRPLFVVYVGPKITKR